MQQFNFENFLKNIEEDIKEARKIASDLGDEKLSDQYREEDEIQNIFKGEKEEFDIHVLEDCINRAILKIKFALEYLGMTSFLEDFKQIISSYKNDYNQFTYISWVGVLVNPVVGTLQDFVDAITCQIDPKKKAETKFEEDQSLLERILIGTPKIITDNGLEPKNESEIRNAVYKLLIHVFPDTVREIPISKVSKVYKPDIGIRKLKTAIEYKFADSLEELKKSIGGIFEDVKGYEGSEDWKTFYAVIYQTDHFMTQAQIDEEFKLSKVEHNWKPILVYGKGERLLKQAKSTGQKKKPNK